MSTEQIGVKDMKSIPNYYKINNPTAVEELAVELTNQLAESIAENIKLNSQLRVLSKNYNAIVKEYLEMADKSNNNK